MVQKVININREHLCPACRSRSGEHRIPANSIGQVCTHCGLGWYCSPSLHVLSGLPMHSDLRKGK